MISFPVLGIYPPLLLLSKKKHPIFRRCAQATSNTTLQDFPLRQNQEKWISATEFQKLKTHHATWPEVQTLEIFAGLTGAWEQCLITNKAYKKLVDLCNSSFLTEAWGSRRCVMAMQNNLVDFHLASPTWESWNHSWIYHNSLPTSTKKNQNSNCRSCCWKEQGSMSRAEGWKPEEHTAQSHEITPSYLEHLFKKQCIQNSSRCQYLWVLMVSHTSQAHMHQNFVTVL